MYYQQVRMELFLRNKQVMEQLITLQEIPMKTGYTLPDTTGVLSELMKMGQSE